MTDNFFDFIGGSTAQWEITRIETGIGQPLDTVSHLNIIPSSLTSHNSGLWTLKGFTSNIRYAEKEEKIN
jgi:hypothetical protein